MSGRIDTETSDSNTFAMEVEICRRLQLDYSRIPIL
jgi:hypothetical protein